MGWARSCTLGPLLVCALTGCEVAYPTDTGGVCLVGEIEYEVEISSHLDRTDLLLVIDDSPSMAEEQATLRDQLPAIVRTMTTGEQLNPDGSIRSTFPAVEDLHVAVVTTSVGADCGGAEDGARFRGADGCADGARPEFLAYRIGEDAEAVVDAASCLGDVGTDGCGTEQPLEAALAALTAAPDDYLRNDPNLGTSLLGVMIFTDEDDCSSERDSAPNAQDVDPSCEGGDLFPVERYIEGLRELRRGEENQIVFAAVAGVPPDLVTLRDEDGNPTVDLDDGESREQWYARLAADPRMQGGTETAACESATASATPARRLLEVARGFGGNGIVQSICQADFTSVVDPFIEIVAKQQGMTCLPRKLFPDGAGRVDCEMRWELPTSQFANPGVPTSCDQVDFLDRPRANEPQTGERGGQLCGVPQLAVPTELRSAAKREGIGDAEKMALTAEVSASGDGWYYDDFSVDVTSACAASEPQNIAYSEGAEPPPGATVLLRCTLVTSTDVVVDDLDDAFYSSLNAEPPALGSYCSQVPDRVNSKGTYYDSLRNDGEPTYASATDCGLDGECGQLDRDVLCRIRRAELDDRMVCHPDSLRCVRRCAADADCPTDWVCDNSADAAGGSAICINPGCEG